MLCYEITLASTSLYTENLSLHTKNFLFFSSRKFLYQLWNVKSPESLYTFENPYSTSEKRVREFLLCKIVLYFFSATPQSAGPVPPKTTLRAQRRKCVVKYLTWSIPSPPPAANPFLCQNPSHLTLALPPFLSLPILAGSIASYEHPVFCIIKYATPTSQYSDFMGNSWMK